MHDHRTTYTLIVVRDRHVVHPRNEVPSVLPEAFGALKQQGRRMVLTKLTALL